MYASTFLLKIAVHQHDCKGLIETFTSEFVKNCAKYERGKIVSCTERGL